MEAGGTAAGTAEEPKPNPPLEGCDAGGPAPKPAKEVGLPKVKVAGTATDNTNTLK